MLRTANKVLGKRQSFERVLGTEKKKKGKVLSTQPTVGLQFLPFGLGLKKVDSDRFEVKCDFKF